MFLVGEDCAAEEQQTARLICSKKTFQVVTLARPQA